MMYIKHTAKILLFFLPVVVVLFSSSNVVADVKNLPEPKTWNEDLKEVLFDDEQILDGSSFMFLKTPYRAADAAMMPISLKFKNNQNKDFYVKNVTIVVDENPSPVVGKFFISMKSGNADLETRIRIDKYTYVRVIAEFNNGKKYMVSNFVKAAGGCSAPSLGDMDAMMARLGKMKMKFLDTKDIGNLSKAQLVISHPNFSGLQFNQISRSEIPAHFVDSVQIKQDNEIILDVKPDISLSEDPSITFHYINSGGPLKVKITDSKGGVFLKEWKTSDLTLNN